MKLRRNAEPSNALEAAIQEETQRVQQQTMPHNSAASFASLSGQSVESPRLSRMAQYFLEQGELLSQMRTQIEQETSPLIDLLIRNEDTLSYVIANFDERLRPLEAYATTEERNLAELQNRLTGEGGDHLARSFSEYLTAQRQRIDETRARITQQREPFLRYREDQQQAIEVALSRFDGDISALEDILAEQRRVTMRLLDAMRSEAFVAVKDYLAERHDILVDVVTNKVTDPGQIADAMRASRTNVPKQTQGAGAEHLNQVLRATDESDRRFASASPDMQRRRTQNGKGADAGDEMQGSEFAQAERVAEGA
jgi:hypothetical protein